MKIRVTLKDPDTMHDAVSDAFAKFPCPSGVHPDEWEHIKAERSSEAQSEISRRWMEYGEYLEVEFDLDAKTATVIGRK